MKPIVLACILSAFSASPVFATTITFGTFTGSGFEVLSGPYTESGYIVTNASGLARWENGSIYDSDPTSSTGMISWIAQTETVITHGGGGPFDLLGIDIDDAYNSGTPNGALDYQYGLFGGGTGSGSLLVDDVPGFSSILLNLANLSYFSFIPSGDLRWVQFDNVRVASNVVPIPAALPLFASALAAVGWVAHRRRRGDPSGRAV